MKLLYNAESGPQATHVTPYFVENCDVLVVGAGHGGRHRGHPRGARGMRVVRGGPAVLPWRHARPARYSANTMARRAGSTRKSTRAPAHFRKRRGVLPSQGVQRLARMQALEEMFAEEGVCTRYETFVLGVFVEGRRIAGVRCVSHGRVEDLSCAFAIDGTSEGYLCAMAGCTASLGRACDGRTQPFSSFRSPARRAAGPRGIPTAILAMWIPAAARRFPAPC